MNFSLEKLSGIDKSVIEKCFKYDVYQLKDVLELNLLELLGIGLSEEEAKNLVSKVSLFLIPVKKIKSVKELYDPQKNQTRFLKTGIVSLDSALNGGIPFGSITECVGPSGVGKTQFCLTLLCEKCVSGKVLYLDTERTFDIRRVKQILENRISGSFSSGNSPDRMVQYLKNITHVSLDSVEDLQKYMGMLCDTVMDDDVSFVILDSIAAHVRREFDSLIKRQRFLNNTASMLKNVAEVCDIPLVVTNHFTVRGGNNNNNNSIAKKSKRNVPALGNTWAHCVNTRLVFGMQTDYSNNGASEEVRTLTIEKSPHCPQVMFKYMIADGGIYQAEERVSEDFLGRDSKRQKTF